MLIMKQVSIKGLFLPAIVLCSLLFSGNAAHAALVTYSFTGEVDKVQKLLNPPFSVNLSPSAMSGFMTVNTSDLDTSIPARFGEYTITNFSLNIEGQTYGLGTFNQVEIRDGLPGQDQFNVTVSSPNGPFVGSRFPSTFDIQLHGPASIFGSDTLPTTSPSISSFTNQNLWRLVFGPGGKAVSGVVTAMTVVPLPAAVILFGAGLISLVGLGAGGLRNLRWPQV
jgi:hypothetical protein